MKVFQTVAHARFLRNAVAEAICLMILAPSEKEHYLRSSKNLPCGILLSKIEYPLMLGVLGGSSLGILPS